MEHTAALVTPLDPLVSQRTAARAFVEASKRWYPLLHEGHKVVYERVESTLANELTNVDNSTWKHYLNQRLGKVAGYEFKLAGDWIYPLEYKS